MSLNATLRNSASRFAHLAGIVGLPRAARRAKAGKEKPNAEGEEANKDKDKNKPTGEAAATPPDDKNAANKGKPEGEATRANSNRDENAGDDDEEDEEDEEDDDEEDDEEEMQRCEAAGFHLAMDAARRVGARAATRRIEKIFASEHAAGRVPLACELAFSNRRLSAKRVIGILASSAPGAGSLAAAMATQPRHDARDNDTTNGQQGAQKPRDTLFAAVNRISGQPGGDPVDALAEALRSRLTAQR